MITNKTAREFIIAKKLFPGGGSVIETDTASGAIANFETNMSAPIVEGIFAFNPVQEGTGDPSPTNDRPITGFTGLNVTRCGKNLFDYSKSTTSGLSKTNGVYVNTSTDSRTKFYFTIQAFKGSNYVRDLVSQQIIETAGTYSYTFSIASSVDYDRIRIKHNGSQADLIIYYIPFNFKGSFVWSMKVTGCDPSTVGGLSFEECLLAFGTDSTFEQYTGTTYPITWQTEAGTVYGGSLNVTTGVLTVTYAKITIDENTSFVLSGNLVYTSIDSPKIVNEYGNALCDQAKWGVWNQLQSESGLFTIYKNTAWNEARLGFSLGSLSIQDFKNLLENNPFNIVYELATPQTYQLTPTEIATLLGVNNIWHDANGNSSITYQKKVPGPNVTDKRQFLPLIYGKKYYRKEY